MENLRKIRENRNINQLKVAMDLEITQESISKYETNRAMPSSNVLIKLADYFNCSTDYLLEHINSSSKTVATLASDSDISPQDKELLHKYHALTDEHKGLLNGQLDAMYNLDKPKVKDTAM